MKTKTRKIPDAEYGALFDRLIQTAAVTEEPDYQFFMLTGDMESTQSMLEARWLLINGIDSISILQVDGIGDAILLIPE